MNDLPKIVYRSTKGEPDIVVDNGGVELEERYDAQGNLVGYYRYTSGTNCGVVGCVKLEYLDLNKNVLKTFEPQMAGCTMGYGRFGENDITQIWESNENGTSIEYGIEPFANGRIQTCIYTLEGNAIRVDIYGKEGQIVASVEPTAEGKCLDVFTSDEGYHVISEGYIAISVELRNANGDIRGFKKLEENSRLAVFITDAGTTVTIGEYIEYGQIPIKTVVHDPINDVVIDTQIAEDYQK